MSINKQKFEQILSGIGDIGLRQRVNFIVGNTENNENIKILDLGCGEGLYTFTLANSDFRGEIVAFDFNAELLKRANNWVDKNKKINFTNGDLTKALPFPNNYFDIIIFTEVLEHIDDEIKPLKEIYRILKNDGKLFLTVPNKNFPFKWDPLNKIRMKLGLGHFSEFNTILGGVWSYDHKRLYCFDDLERLSVKSNFKFVKKVSLTHECLLFNYLILRVGKVIGGYFPDSNYSKAIEKFEINKNSNKSLASIAVKYVFKLVKNHYLKNITNENNLAQSSISIGGILVKKDHG